MKRDRGRELPGACNRHVWSAVGRGRTGYLRDGEHGPGSGVRPALPLVGETDGVDPGVGRGDPGTVHDRLDAAREDHVAIQNNHQRSGDPLLRGLARAKKYSRNTVNS